MTDSKPGTGSACAITVRDSTGQYLDGGRTYKVTLPGPLEPWFNQTWRPGDVEPVK
jgi:hypothetical protein